MPFLNPANFTSSSKELNHMIRLTTLTAVTALALVTPLTTDARADQFRHADNMTATLHRQTVEYVRWLKYHVPPSAGLDVVQRDALNVYCGVSDLQKAVLFGSGSNEVRSLRRHAKGLSRMICDSRRNIELLLGELRHDQGYIYEDPSFGHRAYPTRKSGVLVRVVSHPRHGRPQIEPIRHHHGGFHHERAQLRVLRDRLATMQRTLESLDQALYRH
jgi:hypothetical protein